MRIMRSRTVLLLLITAAVLAATAAAWVFAHNGALADLVVRANEGLSLKKSNVVAEADRYRYLPLVVAQDDRILKLLDGPDDPIRIDLANRYLQTVNRSAGSHDLFVMDHTATVLASNNWQDEDSRVGVNYADRVYFKDAVATTTGEGRQYVVGRTTRVPGYLLARRVDTTTASLGVAAVKVDLSPLEDSWSEAGELAGLMDPCGMIFISNVKAWKYSPLYPLSKDCRERLERERPYPPEYLNRPPLLPEKPGETFFLPL